MRMRNTKSEMRNYFFFFLGKLAFWLLLRFNSIKSLLFVALCLLLSILSKETGVVFIVMVGLYLLWFDRKRLLPFIGIMTIPITVYMVLRVNAVGFFAGMHSAPIDELSLPRRLATVPAIIAFYLYIFVSPIKLARAYYWTYPSFSFHHTLLPLAIDLAILFLVIYLGCALYKKLPKDQFLIFVFFATWVVVGFLVHIQVTPLDMTACDTWLYFSMLGLLGVMGILIAVFLPRSINPYILFAIAMVLIGGLAFRSAIRGTDYSDWLKITLLDIKASKENYVAYNNLAANDLDHGDLNQAKIYAELSVASYHTLSGYENLGRTSSRLGDYKGALDAYKEALSIKGDKQQYEKELYEKIGNLSIFAGNYSDKQVMLEAIKEYPTDSLLWMYLAILEDKYNDNAAAKISIQKAVNYGSVDQTLYNAIMSNQSFNLKMN